MLSCYLIIFILHFSCVPAVDFKNPQMPKKKLFEVIMDRTEIIFETPSIVEWHIQIKKVNKTRSIVGHLTFHEPFGNNFKVEGKVLKKQGGEYRYLPYAFPQTPICDALIADMYVYPDAAKQSDFPEDISNECPFVPGNYSFYGFAPNLEKVPTVAAPSGEYGAEVYYYTIDQHIATYRIYGFINNV